MIDPNFGHKLQTLLHFLANANEKSYQTCYAANKTMAAELYQQLQNYYHPADRFKYFKLRQLEDAILTLVREDKSE